PLQPFWPLQALDALLHAPCPLHSLTPAHMTVLLAFFSFLPSANAAPDTNREATAVARTAFFIDMDFLQESGLRTEVRSARDFVTCVNGETQETFPRSYRASMSREKAETLRRLHARPAVLLLTNAWHVASARIVDQVGLPAF